MKAKLYAAIIVAAVISCTTLQAQTNTFPASGSVGIGTTTPDPSAKLDIRSVGKGLLLPHMTQAQRDAIPSPAKGLLIYQTDNNPGFFYYTGSIWSGLQVKGKSWSTTGNQGTNPSTNFLGTTDAQDLVIKTNAVQRMRITKTGSVGIGTGTPAAKLQVTGGTGVTLTGGGNIVSGDIGSYNIAMDGYFIQGRYNGGIGYIYLNYAGGYTYLGPSGAVYINNSGNLTTSYPVGILGSYNSSYALNVNASSSYGGINITDPVDNTGINLTKSGLNYGLVISKTNTTSAVETISSSNAGSGAGIYASSAKGYGVYGYNSGGNTSGVYGYSAGGTGSVGVTGYCAGVGYGMAAYGTSGSGIYATSTSNYAGYFVGDVFSSGSYVGSDQKLKENIKDVVSAMDIISQLHPKLYNFKNDGDYKLMNLPKGLHYGLIAQDVEKVLPNIVKDTKFETGLATPPALPTGKEGTQPAQVKSETIDFKAVNYTELIPLLIKGMQEQQQEINELKQQVAALTGNSATDASSVKVATLTSAMLFQNTPNPYKNNTTIQYNLPAKFSSAEITVSDNSGKIIKQINVSGAGKGSVNINASSLAAGTYNYSLMIDGRLIDTKQMILTK